MKIKKILGILLLVNFIPAILGITSYFYGLQGFFRTTFFIDGYIDGWVFNIFFVCLCFVVHLISYLLNDK